MCDAKYEWSFRPWPHRSRERNQVLLSKTRDRERGFQHIGLTIFLPRQPVSKSQNHDATAKEKQTALEGVVSLRLPQLCRYTSWVPWTIELLYS